MSESEKSWWEREQFSGVTFPRCKMYTADVAPLGVHPDGENLWNDPSCQPSSCSIEAKSRIQEIVAGSPEVFDDKKQLYQERLKCHNNLQKLGRDRAWGVFAAARKEKDLRPGCFVRFFQRRVFKQWF